MRGWRGRRVWCWLVLVLELGLVTEFQFFICLSLGYLDLICSFISSACISANRISSALFFFSAYNFCASLQAPFLLYPMPDGVSHIPKPLFPHTLMPQLLTSKLELILILAPSSLIQLIKWRKTSDNYCYIKGYSRTYSHFKSIQSIQFIIICNKCHSQKELALFLLKQIKETLGKLLFIKYQSSN